MKRIAPIFLIAASTACGIIICQLYWVYYNYNNVKRNFNTTATLILRESVSRYQLGQNKLPTSLDYKKSPTLTFMVRTLPDKDPLALDTPNSTRRFSAEFATVSVDKHHIGEMKALVARLLSQQNHKQINIDTLSKIFHQELLRNRITEEFRLSLDRSKQPLSQNQIGTPVSFYKDPVLLLAELKSPYAYLLKINALSVIASSLLILVAAFSLLNMGRIIKRQAQLDTMKTDFINNMLHQLLTPLSILRSSNEALANFGAAGDEKSLKHYLGISARIINDMDSNIEQLMEFSRSAHTAGVPDYGIVDLGETVEQIKTRLHPGEDRKVLLDFDQAPFLIRTDPFMIGVILTNLLDNAFKYAESSAPVEVCARRSGNKWQLSVRDGGYGIPASALPYIFDRFYRVPTGDEHETKGYGIGLAHVKQLVSSLGGKISVNSKPGHGSTFTLTFLD
jgi:two-component system phosphate regulon sensor histidine kinase PhoR